MILNNQQQQEEQVKKFFCFTSIINNSYILVSIITILAVICLSIIHIATFQSNTLKYDYNVDWDHDSKLKINIDMTVAMSCAGKDIFNQEIQEITNSVELHIPEKFHLEKMFS
jgi:hypothetical protein